MRILTVYARRVLNPHQKAVHPFSHILFTYYFEVAIGHYFLLASLKEGVNKEAI